MAGSLTVAKERESELDRLFEQIRKSQVAKKIFWIYIWIAAFGFPIVLILLYCHHLGR